jgi:hypothetical protein
MTKANDKNHKPQKAVSLLSHIATHNKKESCGGLACFLCLCVDEGRNNKSPFW